jgi:hypothetical protein
MTAGTMAGLLSLLGLTWMAALGVLTVQAIRFCASGRRWFEHQLDQDEHEPRRVHTR